MAASQVPFTVLSEAQVVIAGGPDGITVTVKLQLAPVVVVQVTTVAPTWNTEPEAGLQVAVPQGPEDVGSG